MTSVLSFTNVVKNYGGLRPLRLARLNVAAGEAVSLSGLDVHAAEIFVNLATGASLPDQGEVAVTGQPTSAITEGDSWLASLDRFGIVSHRAVLLEPMTAAQNIAMSFSLSIDPVSAEIRKSVDALAREVGIEASDLDKPVASLSGAGKVRVHLARALSADPALVLLEHPTLHVDRADVDALAGAAAASSLAHGAALVAITDDEAFAKALKGRRLKLNAATGALTEEKKRWWF